MDDADLLACFRAEHPAFRTGADLDRIDPCSLSAGERVDLLVVLEEQRRWFEAAQLRVLAVMQERDTSKLCLAQESVSLVADAVADGAGETCAGSNFGAGAAQRAGGRERRCDLG